jgi:hypothetical protein
MYYNLIGIVFLIYGFAKIAMVTSLIFIPPEIKKRLALIEGFDFFVSLDDTLAGHMYEYILLVFAVFSIIHGLALLGVFRESFHDVIERKSFQYPFYIALGLWMMIFYISVIYTNIPIEKDMQYVRNYKIYCYLGGLSFLLVPFIWEAIEYFNPKLYRMRQDTQLMYMTLLMLVAIFIIFLVYIVTMRLKKLYDKNNLSFTNLYTLNQKKQETDKKEV